MPVLWTNIYIAPYSHTACVPVYQHYLQRCGRIPICIKVEIPVKVHPHLYDDNGDHPSGLIYKNHVDVMADVYESSAQWRHAKFYINLAGIKLLQDLSGLWADDTEQLEAPNLNS
ncbi:hypothetical protein CPB85DRAFT_1436428 [Mucidula mucida]|nr:hypothetical protein CPB85DRAFT_1436428 [Mucidula mucida]